MIRIPLALAAATFAIGLGHAAQAQMPAAPMQQTPSAAMPTDPSMTAPPPGARHHMNRPMRGQAQRPMAPGMAGQVPAMQPPMTQPPVIAGGMVQPPAQPFSNLNLPNTGVGDGAYGGGGMVIEYLPDGSRRIVQQ